MPLATFYQKVTETPCLLLRSLPALSTWNVLLDKSIR
jgi:hypothetical protein